MNNRLVKDYLVAIKAYTDTMVGLTKCTETSPAQAAHFRGIERVYRDAQTAVMQSNPTRMQLYRMVRADNKCHAALEALGDVRWARLLVEPTQAAKEVRIPELFESTQRVHCMHCDKSGLYPLPQGNHSVEGRFAPMPASE